MKNKKDKQNTNSVERKTEVKNLRIEKQLEGGGRFKLVVSEITFECDSEESRRSARP